MTDQEPILRVVRGHPTAEELAALLVVMMSTLSAAAPEEPRPTSTDGWAARWRGLRTELRPGRDAWRLSDRA